MKPIDSTILVEWYRDTARDLPWRNSDVTAWQVLISEVMLQQTQVATVLPYFERFVAAWPSIADLAAAAEQDVLRAWEGLGYYRRARHLAWPVSRCAPSRACCVRSPP